MKTNIKFPKVGDIFYWEDDASNILETLIDKNNYE